MVRSSRREVLEVSHDGISWEATGIEGEVDCATGAIDVPRRLVKEYSYGRKSTSQLDGTFIEHIHLWPARLDC